MRRALVSAVVILMACLAVGVGFGVGDVAVAELAVVEWLAAERRSLALWLVFAAENARRRPGELEGRWCR